jgi:uncharacterized protein (DUF2249 family)
MQCMTEIDIQSLSPTEQPPYCLACFDRLALGESMILVTHDDPKLLLESFHRERPNLFEWNPLESVAALHRVQVSRRVQGSPRRVEEFLEVEHFRLDSALADVGSLANQGLFDAARRYFAEFRHGLERHLTMEEAFVLPAFQRAGGTPEVCARLLNDHGVIRRMVEGLARVLRSEDSVGAMGQASDVSEALGAHAMRKAEEVYPRLAELDAQVSAELVRRMQGMEDA